MQNGTLRCRAEEPVLTLLVDQIVR